MCEERSYIANLSGAIDAAYADYKPGEDESVNTLYKALEAQAANIVHHHLESADKDLVSDIVHRAMFGLKTFRNESKLSTWFYALAQNEARRALRKQIDARNRYVPLIVIGDDGEERPRPIEAHPNDQNARIDVDRLRRKLPPKQDEVVGLMAEGYSLEEIAPQIGEPLGTVRSRYNLAKKKMAPRSKRNSLKRK
jgi:RNA polymerase sigma-70 factor, ECF subfamily